MNDFKKWRSSFEYESISDKGYRDFFSKKRNPDFSAISGWPEGSRQAAAYNAGWYEAEKYCESLLSSENIDVRI